MLCICIVALVCILYTHGSILAPVHCRPRLCEACCGLTRLVSSVIFTRTYLCTRTHTHALTSSYIHTPTHTYTHTHTHTHLLTIFSRNAIPIRAHAAHSSTSCAVLYAILIHYIYAQLISLRAIYNVCNLLYISIYILQKK